MSLKGDRNELDTDISFFMNEVATRGLVVSVSTAGSGAAMDNGVALATVKTNPSGAYPLGILLNDMVNIDLTRQHLNQHKDEVQKGGKITILRKGFVVTDAISGTPSGGQDAYLAGTGLISATQAAGALKIGQFLSSKDADGFAKVAVNL
jgi:antitoxin (DNA-binding transcriptional repressor) of toxin-antitoxin stability system